MYKVYQNNSILSTVFEITPEKKAKAEQWSDFFKNNRTIKQQKQNCKDDLTGALGEICFQEICPNCIRISNFNTQSDFITQKGLLVDVKTKKRKTFVQNDFNVSVSLYQKEFKCDAYAFFNYAEKNECVEFIGLIEKALFWQYAQIIKKGEKYPNGFTCSLDCANLTVEQTINLIQNH
jgi:hypothetical protein